MKLTVKSLHDLPQHVTPISAVRRGGVWTVEVVV